MQGLRAAGAVGVRESGRRTAKQQAIRRAVAGIVVGGDGSMTIEARPGGLLGVNGTIAQVDREEGALIDPRTLSAGGRVWNLITAR